MNCLIFESGYEYKINYIGSTNYMKIIYRLFDTLYDINIYIFLILSNFS